MLTCLKLRNFKCFSDTTIDLKELTILAGGNATGKSSVMQAILLYAFVPKKNSLLVDVNDAYDLNLGVAKSLISHDPKGDDNFIEMSMGIGGRLGKVLLKPSDQSPNSLEHLNSTPNLDLGNLYLKYLKAERLGSRTSTKASSSHDDLGYSGEFTPSVIENADNSEVRVHDLLAKGKKATKFSAQVENWISAIMGNMNIDVTTDYTKGLTDMRIKNPVTEFGVSPTLTGFGISYVLPIVVAGLLCSSRPDSVLLIENPEAHLHPMAQSNIGKFLAILAQCGVQVIAETHSEHIIDGARLQLKNDKETDRMVINFFEIQRKRVQMETISLNSKGELTHWPKGFFDQKQQDLRELLSK